MLLEKEKRGQTRLLKTSIETEKASILHYAVKLWGDSLPEHQRKILLSQT